MSKRDKTPPAPALGEVLNRLPPEVHQHLAVPFTSPEERQRAEQARLARKQAREQERIAREQARIARRQDPARQAQRRAERRARKFAKLTPQQREYVERQRAIKWGEETRAAIRADRLARRQAAEPPRAQNAEEIRLDQIEAARKMLLEDDEK